MVKINDFRKTGTKAQIDALRYPADQRTYLGMSGIGHPCRRYLWYEFRWAFREIFTARQMRLFGRGHKEEPIIIAELAKIGVKIDGEQQGYVACMGHHRGHSDGKAYNVPEAPKTTHVAEFKTMNDKNFKKLIKEGLAKSKPTYYAQIQSYMREEKLTRCLFIAVNKNDDQWYVNRYKYDDGFAQDLLRKAEEIIFAATPDKREFPAGWYECSWCSAREICEGRELMQENCRTCVHSDPITNGQWFCRSYIKKLWDGAQRLGKDCPRYDQIKE